MTKENDLIIPALKAHMGDWIYYVTILKMEHVAEMINIAEEIHTSKVLRDMIQRQITARAKQISGYLINQPQRFFNAIVVGVYGGSPDWYELAINSNPRFSLDTIPNEFEGIIGFLRFDGSQTLYAIDGQHRVKGIRQALKENGSLNSEEVSALFVAHRNDTEGMERTRRLFTTLNRYAKPVSKSDIVALDEDDIVAIVTRRLVENHSLFQDKISLAKTKAIGVKDNRSFTTIITLYDVLDILFRERGRYWNEYKRHRPNDDEISRFYENSVQFWDTMAGNFTAIGAIRSSQPTENVAGDHRHRQGGNLLFRPIGLLIIANVVRKAKDSGLSEKEAIERISEVSMEISKRPWVGLLWDKVNQRMINERPHQKVAKNLLYLNIGGNLAHMKTSYEKLLQEYAGILKRDKTEVLSEMYQGPTWKFHQ